MPLACLVEGAALVLHGGLFRKPPTAAGKGGSGAKKRPRASLNSTAASVFELGSLNDLRASAKGNQVRRQISSLFYVHGSSRAVDVPTLNRIEYFRYHRAHSVLNTVAGYAQFL